MEHTIISLLLWSISNLVFSVLVIRFFLKLGDEKIYLTKIRQGLYSFILEWDRHHNGVRIDIEKVLKLKLLKNGK